jgi:hypothetical protein
MDQTLMSEKDLYWLAGLLEGEGSFLKGPPSAPHQPRISLSMTDEDVIKRVSSLWGVKHHPVGKTRCLAKRWTPAFGVCLKGSKAAVLMEQLYPLMGRRRQSQIQCALACYQIKPHPTTRLDREKVAEIKLKLANRVPVKEIAVEYKVNVSTIYQVRSGQNWSWVETQDITSSPPTCEW